jgi:hypothetical protein
VQFTVADAADVLATIGKRRGTARRQYRAPRRNDISSLPLGSHGSMLFAPATAPVEQHTSRCGEPGTRRRGKDSNILATAIK